MLVAPSGKVAYADVARGSKAEYNPRRFLLGECSYGVLRNVFGNAVEAMRSDLWFAPHPLSS